MESFANPEDMKKFIYLGAFWKVMGDDYHGAYPQFIQLIVIFAIIEKLYENERFIDFYTWLDSERWKESEKDLTKNCRCDKEIKRTMANRVWRIRKV
jgi:hypothetical protein